MENLTTNREERRLTVQAELDAGKDRTERNRMGQFATPTELALEILEYARKRMDGTSDVRFLDPAIGTGSFFSALLKVFPTDRVSGAVGYELDSHYGEPAARLWHDTILDLRLEDFTLATPSSEKGKFNLLICNPPYVRHHHIQGMEKRRLKALVREACGIDINGLAGLYCYFLCLSHRWMEDGGLAGWLIPSEFMDVNYGASVKRYLLDTVTLRHIHRFDPNEVQFGDSLVSSSVVWFSKEPPPLDHKVRMTYGGSLLRPRLERLVTAETLRHDTKWTRYPMKEGHAELPVSMLADFFDIKRGLATGNNRYFILSKEDIQERGLPLEAFRPILPSPRYLPETEVFADRTGNPLLERQLFLLECRLSEEEVREQFPTLSPYLEEGKALGVSDRYLCRHRSPWYAQENRPPAPFLCTYLGRSDKKNGPPFRFILNHSNATAPNVYLMLYPKGVLDEAIKESPQLKWQVWEFLNGIDSKEMLNEGRVYGGGLHKLEPKELGRVPASALTSLLLGAHQ
jgi:adenine-specific DNA-methyltransferase